MDTASFYGISVRLSDKSNSRVLPEFSIIRALTQPYYKDLRGNEK